jgi:glycosyltransferase involved in cell wall biosynthesis
MRGVAPIKLGEYLLMNLPTIASKGIGDSEEVLQHFDNCFLFDHNANQTLQQNEIMSWLQRIKGKENINTREEALKWFSLSASADRYINVIKNLK